MTFAEFKAETELLYESINSSAAPGFTDAEWGQLLTIAQRKVVKTILDEGVTKNAFNQLAIEKLMQADSYTVTATDGHFLNTDGTAAQTINTGTKAFDVKFFWIIDEYVKTAAVNNIPLKRISFDFYRINKDNPFRKPDIDEGFWLLQYNNKPVFITDGSALTNYYLIGVHHPDTYPIGTGLTYGVEGSWLNEGAHYRIVEEAVKLARMSVIDPQGYQLAAIDFAK
jgi:hypothetical protein